MSVHNCYIEDYGKQPDRRNVRVLDFFGAFQKNVNGTFSKTNQLFTVHLPAFTQTATAATNYIKCTLPEDYRPFSTRLIRYYTFVKDGGTVSQGIIEVNGAQHALTIYKADYSNFTIGNICGLQSEATITYRL